MFSSLNIDILVSSDKICLPFNLCINQKTGEFKNLGELRELFNQNESIEFGTPISQTIETANQNNELDDMFKDIS